MRRSALQFCAESSFPRPRQASGAGGSGGLPRTLGVPTKLGIEYEDAGACRPGSKSVSRSTYAFRRAGRRDLMLLRSWLCTPDVVRWWGDPDEQAALLREDLDQPRMVMRIVSYEGRPFAYAQDY